MRHACLIAPVFHLQMMLVDVHTGIVKACMSNKRTTMDAVPPLGPDSELLDTCTSLVAMRHTAESLLGQQHSFCTSALLPPCTIAARSSDTRIGCQP